jgi:hypothetical protein
MQALALYLLYSNYSTQATRKRLYSLKQKYVR